MNACCRETLDAFPSSERSTSNLLILRRPAQHRLALRQRERRVRSLQHRERPLGGGGARGNTPAPRLPVCEFCATRRRARPGAATRRGIHLRRRRPGGHVEHRLFRLGELRGWEESVPRRCRGCRSGPVPASASSGRRRRRRSRPRRRKRRRRGETRTPSGNRARRGGRDAGFGVEDVLRHATRRGARDGRVVQERPGDENGGEKEGVSARGEGASPQSARGGGARGRRQHDGKARAGTRSGGANEAGGRVGARVGESVGGRG